MNHQQIIELAREAGANVMMLLTDPPRLGIVQMHPQHLEKFAALVAAKEREECAKVVEAAQPWGRIVQTAAAIRARGQK